MPTEQETEMRRKSRRQALTDEERADLMDAVPRQDPDEEWRIITQNGAIKGKKF